MIIEIAGCTSSGKSVFLDKVVGLARARNISFFQVTDLGGVFQINAPRILKILAIDAWMLPGLIGLFTNHRALVSEIYQVSIERDDSWFMRINIVRNALKKLILVKYIKEHHSEKNVILDEGTWHSFSNLYSHYDQKPDIQRLTKHVAMLILPDSLVVLDADSETIAQRALTRADPPWKCLSTSQWKRLKKHTDEVYGAMWLGLSHEQQGSLEILKGDGSSEHIGKVVAHIEALTN